MIHPKKNVCVVNIGKDDEFEFPEFDTHNNYDVIGISGN